VRAQPGSAVSDAVLSTAVNVVRDLIASREERIVQIDVILVRDNAGTRARSVALDDRPRAIIADVVVVDVTAGAVPCTVLPASRRRQARALSEPGRCTSTSQDVHRGRRTSDRP